MSVIVTIVERDLLQQTVVASAIIAMIVIKALKRKWGNSMNNDVAYVIQCAKEVGIEVTEETALDFSLIAEIMRKMKEQKR